MYSVRKHRPVIGLADSIAKAQQNAFPSKLVASVLAVGGTVIASGNQLPVEIRPKEGQTHDLGNVKVTTNRGGNEALTNVVGIKGVDVVVTLKFVFATDPREASVIVFRMNPEPEKSEVTLSVGTTKLVPFMQASPVHPFFRWIECRRSDQKGIGSGFIFQLSHIPCHFFSTFLKKG